MKPNAMAMHPEDAREVLPDEMLDEIRERERLTAAINFALPALSTDDMARVHMFVQGVLSGAEARGTARPLTSASLAAEQQAREQDDTR